MEESITFNCLQLTDHPTECFLAYPEHLEAFLHFVHCQTLVPMFDGAPVATDIIKPPFIVTLYLDDADEQKVVDWEKPISMCEFTHYLGVLALPWQGGRGASVSSVGVLTPEDLRVPSPPEYGSLFGEAGEGEEDMRAEHVEDVETMQGRLGALSMRESLKDEVEDDEGEEKAAICDSPPSTPRPEQGTWTVQSPQVNTAAQSASNGAATVNSPAPAPTQVTSSNQRTATHNSTIREVNHPVTNNTTRINSPTSPTFLTSPSTLPSLPSQFHSQSSFSPILRHAPSPSAVPHLQFFDILSTDFNTLTNTGMRRAYGVQRYTCNEHGDTVRVMLRQLDEWNAGVQRVVKDVVREFEGWE